MKYIFYVLFLLAFILTACTQIASPTVESTQTTQPSPSNTPIPPTVTPTITPSPTLELPVGLKTPIPEFGTEITLDNINKLEEIARYYGNLPYIAKLTKDQSRLFVRDQLGLDIYDYKTNKLILHLNHYIPQTDYNLGLQISDDGKWVLIDGIWLFNTEAEITDEYLKNIFTLAGFKSHSNPIPLTALSLDGKKLAVAESYQNGRFYIIDIETNEIIYKSISGSSPIFSPDNSMIATEVNNQVIVWSILDGSVINKFPLERFGEGVAFSNDSSLIAIRQSSGDINIWRINSGELVQTISSRNSCNNILEGFNSLPVFNQSNTQVALFDCNGNIQLWSVNKGNMISELHYDIDLPSVLYNESGNLSLLSPPRTAGPWIGFQEYQMSDFIFLDNETIALRYYDSINRTYRMCAIHLQSNPDCKDNLTIGTDTNYYKYSIVGNNLKLFSTSTSNNSQPLYEIEFLGLGVNIDKFDPEHQTLLYTTYISDYIADVRLVDLKTGEFINKWEKRRLGASSFSQENTVAAICLDTADFGISFFNNKPKLILIDLAESKSIYEENITCSELALSHSNENRKIAISYDTLPSGSQFLKSLLLIMNFDTHDERQKIDVGCDRNISSLAYSPDDSILAVSCSYGDSDGNIYFLNASDGTEIQLIEGYPGINGLTFSPDGKMLAVSFGGGSISVLAAP